MSEKKKSSGKSGRKALKIAIFVAVFLLVIEFCALSYWQEEDIPLTNPATSEPVSGTQQNSASESKEVETEASVIPTEKVLQDIDLGNGLIITDVAPYTGAYVEDGSDEVVSDVLMVVLENTSQEALQYANISLTFGEAAANFTVSNLPAGQRVVLLEQNRMEFTTGMPDGWLIQNQLFLPEFELYPELFEISGSKGSLTVKNISEQDIAGDIYVYYKNSAQDIYYGGITYRTKVDGLAAGEEKSVIAGHYNPSGSTIVMVTYAP